MAVIEINSLRSLETAADYYHDALLYINEITYNKATKCFQMKLERVKSEEEIVRRVYLGFIRICSAPKTVSLLSFCKVLSVKTNLNKTQLSSKGEPIDFINTIYYYPETQEIQIDCVNGSEIKLSVEQIDGKFEDLTESTGVCQYFYIFSIKFGG